MPTPRQVARLKKMFQAALNEFCRLGYHQANVDEIARQAEVGKATLYRHFKNKEGLFLAVYDHVLNELVETLKAEADFTDYREGSLMTVKIYLRLIEKNPNYFYFFKVFSVDSEVPESHLRQRMADRYFSMASWIIDETRKAQRRGQVRKDIDPEKLLFASIGMIHHLVYLWMRNGREGSLESNADFISALMFDGILAKKCA